MSNLFPETSVYSLRDRLGMSENYDVYIGRKMGNLHPESPYHNPFRIGYDGDRDDVILKFIEYWYSPKQQELRHAAAEQLFGLRLGCWCRPLPCHGDIIAGYVNWKNGLTFHTDMV